MATDWGVHKAGLFNYQTSSMKITCYHYVHLITGYNESTPAKQKSLNTLSVPNGSCNIIIIFIIITIKTTTLTHILNVASSSNPSNAGRSCLSTPIEDHRRVGLETRFTHCGLPVSNYPCGSCSCYCLARAAATAATGRCDRITWAKLGANSQT